MAELGESEEVRLAAERVERRPLIFCWISMGAVPEALVASAGVLTMEGVCEGSLEPVVSLVKSVWSCRPAAEGERL